MDLQDSRRSSPNCPSRGPRSPGPSASCGTADTSWTPRVC